MRAREFHYFIMTHIHLGGSDHAVTPWERTPAESGIGLNAGRQQPARSLEEANRVRSRFIVNSPCVIVKP
jgi:hypothetical protein